MKEITTCEEYVLNELREQKALNKKLSELCKDYRELLESLDTFIEVMKKFLSIHKAVDGQELITMKYVFADYDPEEFKLLKDLFGLKLEEE